MNAQELQRHVGESFRSHFGRTPLTARLNDIMSEAIELQRWTDMQHLQEEAGDLAASLLALFHENGLDFEDAVSKTLDKIERRKNQYASLGRKTKVALLGGAFDPPTLGHIAVAQFVLNSCNEFDEVWLVPCFRHMYNKEMTSCKDRLAMCEIAARGDGRIRVCDYEIMHQLGGETYHFLKSLLNDELSESHQFSCIIGMDNANSFDKWVNFEELERMVRFVVVPRTGEDAIPSVDWYKKSPHLYLRCEQALPETASSVVREKFKTSGFATLSVEKMMDAAVAKYVLEHKLYK